MKKTVIAISIVIVSALLLVGGMLINQNRNKDPFAALKSHIIVYHKPEFEGVDELGNDSEDQDELYYKDLAEKWIKTYLTGLKESARIEVVDITSLGTLSEGIDIITHEIKVRWDALSEVQQYFKTGGLVNGTTTELSFVLQLKLDEGNLRYYNDMSPHKYQELLANEADPDGYFSYDLLNGLYNRDNNYLAVRETEEDEWIITEIASANYSSQIQGWRLDDRSIYIDGDFIAIVHHEDGVTLSISYDRGKSWKKHLLLGPETHLDYHTFATIDFIGDVGYIVVRSHVAINADIATYHRTEDKGKTWTRGPIIDLTARMTTVTMLDEDKIFYVEDGVSNIFSTSDLGETIDVHVSEQTPTIEGSYKDSGLEWEQVYRQATIPYKVGDKYYYELNQGNMGDYIQQSAIRYVSHDQGKTWEFLEHFIYIPESEEKVN